MTDKIQFHRQWWVQKAIDDIESGAIGVSAGLGSGKTHGSVDWHHDRVLLNKGCEFSCYAMPIYQKIHDAAIPTFRKFFNSIGLLEGVDYKIVKNPFPKLVYLSTGHEVHFISANRPDKIVAVEYSHGTGSECGSYSKDALRLIDTRIRDPRAIANQFLQEGAPQGMTHFAEMFDDQGNSDWEEYAPREYYNRRLGYRRFRLTTFDNPFLKSGYAEKLLSIYEGNQPYINSYVFGIFCPLTEGTAYACFSQSLVIEDIEPDPTLDIDLTWDFNASPLAWVAFQSVPYLEYGERKVRDIAVHESTGNASNVRSACVTFALKFPPERFKDTKIHIYGDSSGWSDHHRSDLNDYEIIEKALKELGYRRIVIEALRYNPLETESVEALNDDFRRDRQYICKRCTNYQRSLISTRWKEGQRKLDKPREDDWSHWSDAAKYRSYAKQTGGTKLFSKNI